MNSNQTEEENQNIPFMQKMYDRPFFWLIAGFITMLSFYTLWGVYEVYSLPMSTLP